MSVDGYIAAFPPAVQEILRKVREVVRGAAPDAEEVISYRMPAYKLHGVLVYFAAFKAHIGLYPPVSGDAALQAEAAPYAGEKGNLRFPLDQPIPYALIARIVASKRRQNLDKAAAKRQRKAAPRAGTAPGAGN